MNSLLAVALGNALTALLIAPIAAWVGRKGRRPALAHGLWLLVLLKLVTPPLWTWSVPIPASASVPSEVVAEIALRAPDAEASIFGEDEFVYVLEEGVEIAGEPDADFLAVAPSVAVSKAAPAAAPAAASTWTIFAGESSFPWRSALAWSWGLGTLAWSTVTAVRLRRFRRLLNEARPASDEIQGMSDALAERIGLTHPPLVAMLPGPLSPFVWSLGGSARLLLPASLWDGLDPEQRATLLTHELAHLKRRDHWVRLLELLATALFWWHPVVYWARRGLREAEEQCCDAWVVWAWPKAAKAYATALLETVDFLAEAPCKSALPLAASGLGHVEHLKRRLTMILSGLTPHRLTFAGRILLTGLAAALLPLAPSLAQSGALQAETKPAVVLASNTIAISADDSKHDDDKDDDDDDKDEKKKDKERKKSIEIRVQSAKEEARKAQTEALKARDEAQKVHVEVMKRAEAARAQADDAHRRVINLRLATPSVPAGPRKEASKEDKAALEKARAEMKELSEAMGKAAKRLADLEMKVNGVAAIAAANGVFTTTRDLKLGDGKPGDVVYTTTRDLKLGDGKPGNVVIFKSDGDDAPKFVVGGPTGVAKPGETFEVRTDKLPGGTGEVRVFGRVITDNIQGTPNGDVRVFTVKPGMPLPPVPPVPPTPPAASAGDKDQNKRIEMLERQLEKMMSEIKELRREKR